MDKIISIWLWFGVLLSFWWAKSKHIQKIVNACRCNSRRLRTKTKTTHTIKDIHSFLSKFSCTQVPKSENLYKYGASTSTLCHKNNLKKNSNSILISQKLMNFQNINDVFMHVYANVIIVCQDIYFWICTFLPKGYGCVNSKITRSYEHAIVNDGNA